MILRAIRSQQLIRNRPPKFLAGRAFTAQEIQDIQETVQVCGLSWSELVCTVCEHLDWVTPTGRYKEKSCASALRRLEALGLVKLPARQPAKRPEVEVVPGSGTDPEEEIVGTVREMAPLQLEPVGGKQAIRWGIGGRLERTSATSWWGEGSVVWAVCCLRRPLGRWQSGTAGLDGASKTGRRG